MDSIPTEGDRAYRKRRTLRVEGFDNEEYYAIVSCLSFVSLSFSLSQG